jgi:hypothetical protein
MRIAICFVDSHILNRWKNVFSQLLNLYRDSDVRQTEIHTVELSVAERSLSEADIACAKSENYKSPGSNHIPTEYIQAGGKTLQSEIHKLINYIWNKQE